MIVGFGTWQHSWQFSDRNTIPFNVWSEVLYNCFQTHRQILSLSVVNPVQPSAVFMVKHYTECDFASGTNTDRHQREQRCTYVDGQGCDFCVCSISMSICLHCTLPPRTCVSFYELMSRTVPSNQPLPCCVYLMIKAPALPQFLLMPWHNRACWGFDFFVHSAARRPGWDWGRKGPWQVSGSPLPSGQSG